MTIDERLAFLVQSTESLHASTQELHSIVRQQSEQIAEHSKQLAQDAENIRRLNIAAAHEQRLDDLEDPDA